jgi:hypothetical protein
MFHVEHFVHTMFHVEHIFNLHEPPRPASTPQSKTQAPDARSLKPDA